MAITMLNDTGKIAIGDLEHEALVFKIAGRNPKTVGVGINIDAMNMFNGLLGELMDDFPTAPIVFRPPEWNRIAVRIVAILAEIDAMGRNRNAAMENVAALPQRSNL